MATHQGTGWRHKSRALLCCSLQGIPLPCSSDSLCHPRVRVGWRILEADTGSWMRSAISRSWMRSATSRSWMRSEQVTGQDVVTKKLLCSGVPPKCTFGNSLSKITPALNCSRRMTLVIFINSWPVIGNITLKYLSLLSELQKCSLPGCVCKVHSEHGCVGLIPGQRQ